MNMNMHFLPIESLIYPNLLLPSLVLTQKPDKEATKLVLAPAYSEMGRENKAFFLSHTAGEKDLFYLFVRLFPKPLYTD